ncbi:hypothetical protein ACLBWZ_13600 [Brucellaceae bacterium C25G]
MNNKKISYLAVAFSTFIAATTVASAQDSNNNFEFRGKYNQALQCGAYMGNFTILSQKINDESLEAAFEKATERYMLEAVEYGEKLELTQERVVDDMKKLAATIDQGRSNYSETEIARMTEFCAPDIMPLLK